jgi:hypothetical protein
MKRLLKSILLNLVLMPTLTFAGEFTIWQPPTQVDFDADTSGDVLWILGSAKWGAAGCPNATWVLIDSSVTHREKMLAVVLAAHMAQKTVRFWGTCISADRLVATYVSVQ